MLAEGVGLGKFEGGKLGKGVGYTQFLLPAGQVGITLTICWACVEGGYME
jgi:hypothetical protein